ncbi:Cna B domain protein (fragment) [Candidatus Sulfopaludibacter sp. SbA3]
MDTKEERYALGDTVYKSFGATSLKFGVDINHALQNVIPLYGAIGGVYAFNTYPTNSTGTSSGTGGSPFASFLLGVPNNGGSPAVTLRNVEVPYYYRWNSGAAFIQDDWKLKSNLTLHIGMRYTLTLPRTEKYDHQGVFRPDLSQSVNLPTPLNVTYGTSTYSFNSVNEMPFAFSGIGGNSKYLTPPQWTDFEPRFGFAWSPEALEKHHITLRGGWGMSHTPVNGYTQLPNPDFGAVNTGFTVYPTATTGSTTNNPSYMMRLGENPPILTSATVNQQIYGTAGAPSNGLAYANSLYYQQTFGGYAVSQNYHTPYVNNWSFLTSWQANSTTTVELGYTGNQGIHLFMPGEDLNPKNSDILSAQLAANVSSTATINDPLGRINPITGKVLTVQNGTIGSPYLGFSTLYMMYDAAANSIRHAGYINVTHRVGRGLTFITNYTLSKSLDDASGFGGDKNILTTGQVNGQVAFGGNRALDRSVSTYDQKHVFHATAIYDLPIGRGRKLLGNAWKPLDYAIGKPLDYAIGGWTTTGLFRLNTGFPFIDVLSDTNQLGDLTHTARPNIIPGVPIVNPLYTTSCPVGSGCQPYLNPAAFERPALGELGTAPRTIDGARGPLQQYFDLSVQKNFRLGEKLRLQVRMDGLNILNHPVYSVYPNNAGGTADFMGAPSTATLTAAAYNTWAIANNQPQQSTAAGAAIFNGIVNMVNAQKGASGALPANFFSIPLPTNNFFGTPATSYDITTLQGYKLYQLRTAYNAGFGDLYQSGNSRYIQFGVKLYF